MKNLFTLLLAFGFIFAISACDTGAGAEEESGEVLEQTEEETGEVLEETENELQETGEEIDEEGTGEEIGEGEEEL